MSRTKQRIATISQYCSLGAAISRSCEKNGGQDQRHRKLFTYCITIGHRFFTYHTNTSQFNVILDLAGIPSIVFSYLAECDYKQGNVNAASLKMKLARHFGIAGICITLFLLSVFLLLHTFVFPYTVYNTGSHQVG